MEVVVYDLRNLKSIDLQVRGILGEDFLQHFDMLIDNAHKMLCLDDSSAMRAEIKGTHIEMLTPTQADVPPNSLIFGSPSFGCEAAASLKARLRRKRSVSLQRPSVHGGRTVSGSILARKRNEWIASRVRRLPAQNMKIGSLELEKVSFFTQAGVQKDSRTADFDGLLTMGLFRRVFICHAEHFADS